MKKSILALALAFGVTGAYAQDLTSKKGEPYLPEADDWSIGIDATPFLNYAGNFFGKTGANAAPTWNFLSGNQAILGKMFKDEKTAYRAGIRIGMNSMTTKNMVSDRAATTAPTFPALPTMKENVWKSSEKAIGLTAGIEMRRGKTRLQGYYGGEVGIGFSSSRDKFTYGNALAPTATPAVVVDPVDDAFSGAGNITTDTYGNTARITDRKNGSNIFFGVRDFIGAEYFILPKISLAGEFGWGLGLSIMGKSKTTTESIGGTGPSVGTQTVEGNKGSSFSLDTDNNNSVFGPAASLRMNFHF